MTLNVFWVEQKVGMQTQVTLLRDWKMTEKGAARGA